MEDSKQIIIDRVVLKEGVNDFYDLNEFDKLYDDEEYIKAFNEAYKEASNK